MKRIVIQIYDPWVLEFELNPHQNEWEVRRYRTDKPRPASPSERIPARAMDTLVGALASERLAEVLRSALVGENLVVAE